MGIDRKYYTEAFKTLDEYRHAEEDRALFEKNRIYRQFPELSEIVKKLSETTVAAARLALSGEQTAADSIKNIANINLNLQARRKQIFQENNLDIDIIKPNYKCKSCNDTGYDKDGKLCGCVKAIAGKLAYDELNGSTPLEKCTFELFDVNKYPENARNIMQKIFEFCKNYAYNFKKDSQSILFLGNTGLGKTHLSLSIAGIVLEQGYSVIYGSLSNLLTKIEREHFTENSTSTLESAYNCDLLILDDLGAEFATPFTKSVVYDIINTRILDSKPIIISTNLSVAELEKTYTQRVVSRIFGCYRCFNFLGNDIRFEK